MTKLCFRGGLFFALAFKAVSAGEAGEGALGSIRALQIEPVSCQLQPAFAPETRFYVVDCPEQVKELSIEAESIFPLFVNGAPLQQPRIVQGLGAGSAKVLALQACAGKANAGKANGSPPCRRYVLDLHRKGSSEALLAELLVTSGGVDVALSPPFHPSVSLYRLDVPFGSSSTNVVASAAKGGFVSFTSFSSADQHSQSLDVEVPAKTSSWGSEERPSRWTALTRVKVFVVSADWKGRAEYSVEFGRAPNADATLAAIASNVGAPYPVGAPALQRYMLAVPRGTTELALSATAADKEGAQVTLEGNHGHGYASAVLQLDPAAPYKRAKIRIIAADKVTVKHYTLVVAMTNHRAWAMLEDLVVPGCEGGLMPKFEVDVFHYRCLLSNEVETLKVIPRVMWMPFDQKLQIHVKGKKWKSGNVFQQPLGDDGKAEVDIRVTASDLKHKETYHISAQGSPLEERGRLFTTEGPPPQEPPTTVPVTPLPAYRYSTMSPEPPKPKLAVATSTTTRTARKPHPTQTPNIPDFGFRIHFPVPHHMPGLPFAGFLPSTAAEFANIAGVLAAVVSVVALLASQELMSFMLLLKELQFVAVSHGVAGNSYYALVSQPFRVFLLQVDWPGLDICLVEDLQKGQKQAQTTTPHCVPVPQQKAAKLTVLWLALLPLQLLLLAIGWLEASREEALASKSHLGALGVRGLRLKLLPLVLVCLDVSLLGFVDASAAVLFLPDTAGLKVTLRAQSFVFSLSTLRVLASSSSFFLLLFNFAQLARLRCSKLLAWSPSLGRFADTTTLAVTLRDSAYPRPAATPWAALAEACDALTELRAAVPICGPDREVIHLTDTWRFGSRRAQKKRRQGYDGCLFAVLPPEEALLAREIFSPTATGSSTSRSAREMPRADIEEELDRDLPQRKLLAEGRTGAAAWQLQREHLGLLIWMERRSNAYDALKVQINEAVGHGVITDAEGFPIYDCQGQPLRDLYQYCIYQFPWRPWLRSMEGKSPGCSLLGAREPYRKATGVLAPWVPSVTGVHDLERQQINDWLSEWLVESEAASAAREELRQLRWCSQELQHAVLREMAIAVLEHRSFRAPSGTPREAVLSQLRLEELAEQLPWQQQVDGLGSHEILAFLHEDLMDSDDMPFYDEELVPDFLDATFGVLRFHVRSPGENPNPGAQPELAKRPPIRVSESLSPRRPPPLRVQHSVRRLQVRESLVTAQLPLKHLELMARWLPSFGFIVQAETVASPVAERWLPLFWSFGFCEKCRHCPAAQSTSSNAVHLPSWALYFDCVDRVLAVLAISLLKAGFAEGSAGPAGLLVLLMWPLLGCLLRLRCSGWTPFLPASYGHEVASGRREPVFCLPSLPENLPFLQLVLGLGLLFRLTDSLCLCLLLFTLLRHGLAVGRLFAQHLSSRASSRFGLSSREWKQKPGLSVLTTRSDGDLPYPDFGIMQGIDKVAKGEALPLLLVSRLVGLQLKATQSNETSCGSKHEAPNTNQRRIAGLRKLLVLFEPCPAGLTDVRNPRDQSADSGPAVPRVPAVRFAGRFFKEDVQNVIPVAVTRAQMVGTEELPQLVASVQVVNHLGRPWSCSRHDSFLSLFLPWGLDSRKPASTSQPPPTNYLDAREARQWKHWRNETYESTKLVATWQSQVLSWLDEELAAGSLVQHGVLDLIFFARNPNRGPFKEEVDKLLVPGIFSDEGLGKARFSESRCFREGRVLHYVIASTDLKPGRRAWRPDPLGAHAASLFLSSNSSSCSSFSSPSSSEVNEVNFWRPCLLRLNSRQVTYVLRKDEGDEGSGWSETVACDHGDALEYCVPFVFLDRIEVSRGLRGHEDDECLLTLQGLSSTPTSSNATPSPRNEGSPHPLTITPEPIPLSSSFRSPRVLSVSGPGPGLEAPAALPLVFRVSKADGEVWAKVIEEYGMFTPPLHILHYIGDVSDHPRLPGIVYRHGDGDQLWPDGTRYIGAWKDHTYHGTGQLLDPEGQVIYRGQWAQGMKHGEGFYRFFQEPSGSRAYQGHFRNEEFSGHGILWVVEEDGSLEWVQKHRPWAITRYEGLFSGGSSEMHDPRSLILVDETDSVALQEHFLVLRNEAGVGPHQGPGKAPKDLAAEMYGLDAADLQHCGPDPDAEIWYADGARYRGPCLAGAVPHGDGGTLWEEAGLCFEGSFHLGLRAPRGRATLPNGVVYEGEFSQPGGRRHGTGRTWIPEALQRRLGFCSYAGEYHQGLRHGQGEMMFTDGTVYRGQFEKNRRYGHGHYRNRNGSPIYTGPWKNDEPGTGYADILYPSGHRYKGNVCDGCRDGRGSLWHQDPDGDSTFLFRGQWEADEMHGVGELHCTDGVYRGQFVNGLREGRGRFEYARSAEILSYYEGSWEEDQPHGSGTFVDEHGQEYLDREFEQGELVGSRLTARSKRIFSVKTISSVSLSMSKQKPSTSKVLPGPQKEIPHAGTVCQNAGLLPEEEPQQTRAIDVGSGVSHARSRPAHCGPEDSIGLRWA